MEKRFWPTLSLREEDFPMRYLSASSQTDASESAISTFNSTSRNFEVDRERDGEKEAEAKDVGGHRSAVEQDPEESLAMSQETWRYGRHIFLRTILLAVGNPDAAKTKIVDVSIGWKQAKPIRSNAAYNEQRFIYQADRPKPKVHLD
uniref:Uncharacterized protein n=1 Tax=Vespula pensylvanica TaxID=30213 RepID=A0A834NZ73_VESPE|nr:hypothetical protein H0235_009775 [Vespula pensylvanica]